MAQYNSSSTIQERSDGGIAPASDAAAGAPPLNCIIDESALLAGLKDRTKDNIKHWIRDGAINAFIPLYSSISASFFAMSGH